MIELFKSFLSYDSETGELRRLKTGLIATSVDINGYLRVHAYGRRYLAHRICWLLHHGEWPTCVLDHINHNKHDNRISNLRKATVAENLRNRPIQSNNSSGFKGVSFHKRARKYRAQIKVDGRKIHLGMFLFPEDAHAAYVRAAQQFHREFACAG